MAASQRSWWQDAVIYQIYPRSFADGNGDGVGDFAGIISKLDYLRDLGVDALWLSPHYPSPQVDVGYDVSDYVDVEPEYGSLDLFREFLDGAHQRGLRVIIDLVVNHTSDRHAWFQESRSSPDSPKRDWYVWHPGKDGGPPNNWMSVFGGPAWTQDPATGEWYYHFFFKEQPDLNWHNPEVRAAMYDSVRFWLDMGVDGFRLDAIGTVFEDARLLDHESPLTQAELIGMRIDADAHERPRDQQLVDAFMQMYGHQVEQPGVHEVFRELRSVIDEYEDRLLLGETDRIEYHGHGDDELHLVFNFPLMEPDLHTPGFVRKNQRSRLSQLPPGAWPCNTLGNHDRPRVHSRFGGGINDARARQSLALVLTLKGTPVLYNGEEIGMTDHYLDDPALFKDNLSVWVNQIAVDELGLDPETAVLEAGKIGRDKCRTPMQWDRSANGGFSPPGVETWLPVNANFADGVNVADQEGDPASLLEFYRSMLATRRRLRPLIEGDYEPIDNTPDSVLAFWRFTEDERLLVAMNMSDSPGMVSLNAGNATVEFGTHTEPGDRFALAEARLSPWEVLVARLDH